MKILLSAILFITEPTVFSQELPDLVKLNFSSLSGGDYVGTYYWNSYGVRFLTWARGGLGNIQARVFNTTAPVRDPDLGTPNEKCPGGGKGVGAGGKPSGDPANPNAGENCINQGNALIIQEGVTYDPPDDNVDGGWIKIIFKSNLINGYTLMSEQLACLTWTMR